MTSSTGEGGKVSRLPNFVKPMAMGPVMDFTPSVLAWRCALPGSPKSMPPMAQFQSKIRMRDRQPNVRQMGLISLD